MKEKDEAKRQRPSTEPAPRKRFRLERLEERIAPKGHYNPHSKWVGDGGDGGSSNVASDTGGGVTTIY